MTDQIQVSAHHLATDGPTEIVYRVRWRWTQSADGTLAIPSTWHDYDTFDARENAEEAARRLVADELQHWNERNFEVLIFEYALTSRVTRVAVGS